MAITLLFVVLFVLLFAGVPVAFALLSAAFVAALSLGLPPVVVAQQVAAGASGPTLVAIPLFIFAGELMLRGGISDRLIGLAAGLVGHLRGGLAQINVLSSLFFGGVSGSALADVSAVGGTMIPQMVKRGFAREFAVNVSISAALVALLVPPSHNLILYSASVGGSVSIIDLFAAGVLPALLMTVAIMVVNRIIAVRRGLPTEPFPGWRDVLRRLISALPGLLLVAIIFIGIRAGIFTAVESAAIAVAYALLVTMVIYRSMGWRRLLEVITAAARTSGLILFVIGAASAFGWLLAYLEVPRVTVELLQSMAGTRWEMLLILTVLLLVLGTFMDLGPMILICTPIFLPVARAFGVDPVHFGVILVLTGGIGLITPPVGSVLFVGTAIGGISVGQAVRAIWPFYIAAFAVVMIVVFVPQLSLWLPSVLR